MFQLEHKTVVVTGGASGIGLAISKLFAKQGARVHVLELDMLQAKVACGLINKQGCDAKAHVVDVSNQLDVNKIIYKIGYVHILINNAGIAHVGNAENTTEEEFDRLYHVNVKGAYNCIHAVLPTMKAHGGGVILNMSSIAASSGISDRFAYSMSKGAISAMTLSIAKDFIKDNIRCNSISPARVHTAFVDGFISKNYPGMETEMFQKLSVAQPIGRMGTPEEVANLALFLCSEEAGFITGADYLIDGGFTNLK